MSEPMSTVQLPLNLALPDTASLEGFVGATNAGPRAAVADLVASSGQRLFIHGPADSGKTHLLQAACQAVGDQGERAVYVPLAQLDANPGAVLAGLETLDCVCIDDLSAQVGDAGVEIALIGLIDALHARRARAIFADRLPPAALPVYYADLASRLGWGGALSLAEPSDEDKLTLLQNRAEQRGLELPASTANWLLQHGARGVGDLLAGIDQLDRASLAAQRRLTIPFVKQVFQAAR